MLFFHLKDAAKDEIPYQVDMSDRKPGGIMELNHFCGGAKYGKEWLITGARCLENRKGKRLWIFGRGMWPKKIFKSTDWSIKASVVIV